MSTSQGSATNNNDPSKTLLPGSNSQKQSPATKESFWSRQTSPTVMPEGPYMRIFKECLYQSHFSTTFGYSEFTILGFQKEKSKPKSRLEGIEYRLEDDGNPGLNFFYLIGNLM